MQRGVLSGVGSLLDRVVKSPRRIWSSLKFYERRTIRWSRPEIRPWVTA